MKHIEKATPIAAALTAVSALVCCLPVGFAAAGATATLSLILAPYQSWLLGASVILIGVGAFQLRQARLACPARGSVSGIILGISALIVMLVVLFPQLVAAIVADWLS